MSVPWSRPWAQGEDEDEDEDEGPPGGPLCQHVSTQGPTEARFKATQRLRVGNLGASSRL